MNKKVMSIGVGSFCGAFAAVLLVGGVSGCGNRSSGGINPSETLAVVNGKNITMADFYNHLENKPKVRVRTENGAATLDVENTLGFQALQDVVGFEILLSLAKDEGVLPTDADIAKEMEFQKKLRPQFMSALIGRGLTVPEIKRGLLVDLARERLLKKGVTITNAEVDQYIKDNPDEYTDPARVDMSWVLVNSEEAKKQVDADLAKGESFTNVAIKHSKFPSAKANNGRFLDPSGQSPAIKSLAPALANVVNTTSEQKTTQWLRLLDGWAKFYIERKTKAKPITVTPEMKVALQRRLAMVRGTQQRDIEGEILKKLRNSKVEVRPKFYKDAWKEAMDKFMAESAPAPGSGATATTPTAPAGK